MVQRQKEKSNALPETEITNKYINYAESVDGGENICSAGKAVSLIYHLSCLYIIRYREVCNYDFVAHRANHGGTASHFTQMVWKKSQELGVGVATSTKDGMKCTCIVARYRPAGNWYGQDAKNVLKGTFDESFCNNAVQDDKASSGSSSGRGGGIRRGNRWRHVLGNGSGKGSGSGASG